MDRATEVMYRTFGLQPGCGADEVNRRYRELALVLHPDLRPDDARAPARFRAITAAYGELSRREQPPAVSVVQDSEWAPEPAPGPPRAPARATPPAPGRESDRVTTGPESDRGTDALAPSPREAGGGPGWGADTTPLYDAPAGEPPALVVPLELPFDQAFTGATLPFKTPKGELQIQVPAAVADGHLFTLEVPGPTDAPVTLYIQIRVTDHPRYRREGSALYVRTAVSAGRALIGGTLSIPLPGGELVSVPVPEGSRRGQMISVPGKGMPAPEGRGHLFVELVDSARTAGKRPPR